MSDDKPQLLVDRFVEFGLGMAVAQQMVGSMNHAMRTAYSPGLAGPSPAAAFFVALDGRQAGPFSESELVRLLGERRITARTLIWRPGMQGWKPAADVPEMLRLLMLNPPPLPPAE